MAKCVKDLAGQIYRMSDEEAKKMVSNHNMEYCPKSLWKAQKQTEGQNNG